MKRCVMSIRFLLALGLLSFSLNGYAFWTLKTPPADSKNLAELNRLIYEASIAGPQERSAALKALDGQFEIMKSDIGSLAKAIKENGETAQFNSMVNAIAKRMGGETLVQDFKLNGGPYSVLTKAGGRAAQDLQDFKSQLPPFFSWLDVLGIGAAHAGIRSTACGLFWYTISLGYGTTHAYYSCYR